MGGGKLAPLHAVAAFAVFHSPEAKATSVDGGGGKKLDLCSHWAWLLNAVLARGIQAHGPAALEN